MMILHGCSSRKPKKHVKTTEKLHIDLRNGPGPNKYKQQQMGKRCARYASLPNIMKAKNKPMEILAATDLGIDTTPRVQQIKVEEPPKRKAGIKVANVAELVSKLKNEAKVI